MLAREGGAGALSCEPGDLPQQVNVRRRGVRQVAVIVRHYAARAVACEAPPNQSFGVKAMSVSDFSRSSVP